MMKIQKFIFAVVIVCIAFTACKNDGKKTEVNQEVLALNPQTISLNISGMTCEIGCAKTIESKLSKKEGVTDAKVVFNENTATIAYNANKISKEEIIGFIEGIAGGELYKANEIKGSIKSCKADCKKESCTNKSKEKHACKTNSEKACCSDKNA